MQGAFLIDTYILKQIIDYEAIVLSNVSIADCFNAARRGLEEMLFQNTEVLHTRVQNLSWLYLHSSLRVADENALIW